METEIFYATRPPLVSDVIYAHTPHKQTTTTTTHTHTYTHSTDKQTPVDISTTAFTQNASTPPARAHQHMSLDGERSYY